jgi:hypothetical protein
LLPATLIAMPIALFVVVGITFPPTLLLSPLPSLLPLPFMAVAIALLLLSAIHCTTTVDGHQDRANAVAVSHCDTCRHPLPPPSPITATIAHCNHAAILPSIAHLPLLPIAIVLILCPLPLNIPAGCHIGLDCPCMSGGITLDLRYFKILTQISNRNLSLTIK